MGLFSSSKKKEPEATEQRGYYDNPAGSKDYYLFNNVLYIIQEMKKNHNELTQKIDTVLAQNQKLQERCEALENEVGIKQR